jgi:MFS transporter, ACS family, hexuronate transporter
VRALPFQARTYGMSTRSELNLMATSLEAPEEYRAPPASPAGYFRWVVCALLFFAATINYIDRQVISLLKPLLQREFAWNEIDYSNIVFAFQLAYAIGLLLFGKLMDRLGTRGGFSASVFIWSIAAMAHALASSVLGFAAVRFALSEWANRATFPHRSRRSQSGSPRRNGPSRPEYSTPERTSAL